MDPFGITLRQQPGDFVNLDYLLIAHTPNPLSYNPSPPQIPLPWSLPPSLQRSPAPISQIWGHLLVPLLPVAYPPNQCGLGPPVTIHCLSLSGL